MTDRTQIMGTGNSFRTSESPINQTSAFAQSAGGSTTQASPESFPSLRPSDREQAPLATSGSELPQLSNQSSGAAPAQRKWKRTLILLLLLFITFTAAFLALGGLDLFRSGDGGQHAVAPQSVVAPVVTQETPSSAVAAVETAKPVETKATEQPPVAEKQDDGMLPAEIVPASIPARISDVTSPETQFNINYPELVAPPTAGAKSKTNFVAFEVDAKLSEDPDTRVFSMAPSGGSKGRATLSWSTVSGASLFRCKDLEGNRAGSNYVLYYIDENDKAQRMMAFAVASGAELMLIPPRIPSRGVKRVVLTLEKSVKTMEGNAVRREEVLYSDYKEKALLSKPLK